ncbi:hypothetical protein HGRIS_006707 [Hohenbuehelia grisea]|uniref:Uncharacterized protein n=1 Tax=Hohenbuehelia grisea TaxID=104357 RepID=A0ABR3JBB2_9AGAR
MLSLKNLCFLAAVAASASASILPRAGCDNPIVETDWVDVNGNLVKFETTHCPSTAIQARTNTLNVCGVACTNTCNSDAGTLPPTTEDCGMIKNAITIFQQHSPPSFVVSPSGNKTLSFKTCQFSFVNTGTSDLEYCYTDLSATAGRAGSACFPPVMPLHSEGLCTAADRSFNVIAAHTPGSS